MCHLHYKLAKKCPGVTEAPSAERIRELMREYDIDESGTLSEDEFLKFASNWYDNNAATFAGNLIVSSFISMLLLPGMASILHRETPIVRRMPKAIFKCVFGFGM